jgi:hypothetical protein
LPGYSIRDLSIQASNLISLHLRHAIYVIAVPLGESQHQYACVEHNMTSNPLSYHDKPIFGMVNKAAGYGMARRYPHGLLG